MTDEQLNTLEHWIIAIIREEDRSSGLAEHIRTNALKEEVRLIFGLVTRNGESR